LEKLPLADWVKRVAEGEAEYKGAPKPRKYMKDEFLILKK